MSKTFKDARRYEERSYPSGKYLREILMEEHPSWFRGTRIA